MEYSCVQLDDLPDEILMIIFKKLTNMNVLYSLRGVNKRLNKIAHDSIFTNRLTLLMSSSDGFVHSLPDPILDQFCLHILPKIHQKVKWLGLESLSMERILLATNYPNLSGFGLYNIKEEAVIHLFSDETLLTGTLKNQILSLVIDISADRKRNSTDDGNAIIFTRIFTMFTNLRCLNFGPSSMCHQRLSFRIPFPTAKLSSLKCFSLYCDSPTDAYDELILPLLHRMSNLEKLDLHLDVRGRKTVFDGKDLTINIIHYMPLLNKFTLNIRSKSSFYKQMNLPSNEDIQKTFRDFKDNQIIFCADYFPKTEKGQCHIYSYPYRLKYYNDITNKFPGGIFKCVRKVSLFDERPFEHEFFLRIAQSFPLLERLIVVNQKRQINKRVRKLKTENQDLPIIKYPHLKELTLLQARIDYLGQFLLDTKTCLPNGVYLRTHYRQMKTMTRNFTRSTTRSNCAKLSGVYLFMKVKLPEYFKDYFPLAEIL